MSGNDRTVSLPLLPGYRVATSRPKQFHKSHVFEVVNGIRQEKGPDEVAVPSTVTTTSEPPLADYYGSLEEKYPQMQGGDGNAKSSVSQLPPWVAYDRKVLRFFGYFKEAVHSSPVENFRIRRVVLYYYLEDDTIHVAEPKIENSGIPQQGVYLTRHQVPRPGDNNGFYGVRDLAVGAELPVYGRVFRLVDCDEFTRKFYDANGMTLKEAEPYPSDPFSKKQASKRDNFNKLMNPLKEFMEARLGKPINNPTATRQFLYNDGKVLRFYCRWSDNKTFGERRPYILHYFLADDTVEVLEVQQPNSGRDPFPSLLKRQRLPKDFRKTTSDLSKIGVAGDKSTQFYSVTDFRVGGVVYVYGRPLFICGVDNFTRDFYIRNFGMKPNDFPRLNMEKEPEPIPKMAPPDYNGFGTEEDSLGSFLFLMPKIPKRDFRKLMENDGVFIRFLARFADGCATNDKDRRFIITYYLADDTLGVFEKFQRNSGFVGGKFLERQRVLNVDTEEFFKARDFRLGNVLTINHFKFMLLEADGFTDKFMASNPKIFGGGAVQQESKQQGGTQQLAQTVQLQQPNGGGYEQLVAGRSAGEPVVGDDGEISL